MWIMLRATMNLNMSTREAAAQSQESQNRKACRQQRKCQEQKQRQIVEKVNVNYVLWKMLSSLP